MRLPFDHKTVTNDAGPEQPGLAALNRPLETVDPPSGG